MNSTKSPKAKSNKNKSAALAILKGLHTRVIEQNTNAIKREPAKTRIITAAMDNDLRRILYVMRLVEVKM